jgi:hypothetical protein
MGAFPTAPDHDIWHGVPLAAGLAVLMTLQRVVLGYALVFVTAGVGCHSTTPSKPDGGSGGTSSAGHDGTVGGSSDGGQAGDTVSSGSAMDSGSGEVVPGYCHSDGDCVFKPELLGCACSTMACRCNRDGADGRDGSADGADGGPNAAIDASVDAASIEVEAGSFDGGAGVRCGDRTCARSEVCIQRCLCSISGCQPLPSGTACNAPCTTPGGAKGCRTPCDNPGPECAASTASCPGAPSIPPHDRPIACACPP